MRFSINKTEIQNALSIVSKGISTRSTLPVLSGILIDARGDELTFQATDLELSIQYTVVALVEEEGSIVVPGKLFTDIVKSLPDVAVNIEGDDEHATITCDSSTFTIKTLSADDFPSFPHVDVSQKIEIPFNNFSSMARRVCRVVSKDESRAILTGVLLTREEGMLRMVATDSYRLAVTDMPAGNNETEDFKAVISGGFLSDIASLPKTEEPVTIALAENQIVVTYQNTVFINRRIEGNFPNYKQLIPSSCALQVKMETKQLASAVKRAALLVSPGSPVKFSVNPEAQTVTLSANTQDVGSSREVLSCDGQGEAMEIAFNYAYVSDGLASVESDMVYLETQSSNKPGIFKADGAESYLYLIMPVRIS